MEQPWRKFGWLSPENQNAWYEKGKVDPDWAWLAARTVRWLHNNPRNRPQWSAHPHGYGDTDATRRMILARYKKPLLGSNEMLGS